MKPNFALNLTTEQITLLHRTPGGWHQVGHVQTDDPEFSDALVFLRKTATGLDPSGLKTKLILPASQILYTSVNAPADGASERAAIETALDGATPYPVAELVFDWHRQDDLLKVAAIARETLEEAESFISVHRFNPVSFVAAPESPEIFDGEPFFGETSTAAELTGGPGMVERDHFAVRTVPFPEAAPTTGEYPVAEEDGFPINPEPEAVKPSGTTTGPEPEAAVTASSDVVPAPAPVLEEVQKRKPETGQKTAQNKNLSTAKPVAAPEIPAAEAFSSLETPPVSAPIPDDVPRADATAADETLSLHLDDRVKNGAAPAKGAGITAASVPDLPPVSAASLGPAEITPHPVLPGPHLTPATPAPVVATDTSGPINTPSSVLHPPAPGFIHPSALDDTAGSADGLLHPITDESDAELTVFGARKSATRGKSGHFGLVLGIALVFTIGLAALLAEYLLPGDRSEPVSPQESQPLSPSQAAVTSDENESAQIRLTTRSASPAPDVAGSTGAADEQVAALPAYEAPATLLAPREFTIEDAEDILAATGLHVFPPAAPQIPLAAAMTQPYVPSLDPVQNSFDALALPPVETAPGLGVLTEQHNPAPAGTVFALDTHGFVIPTDEGAVNADGVRVYAGPPSAITGPRPTGARVAQIPLTGAVDYSGFTPLLRPGDLKDRHERARFGGLTLRELAALRPELRPAAPQGAPEIDTAPTEFAVATSLLPPVRPAGFNEIVTAARARLENQPATAGSSNEATATASAGSASTGPVIPTRASVARQATIPNAINLRRVSLIGVYGTSSDRRALIRLRSGRYVKVEVGDRVDGGRVAAISANSLQYIKGGRNVTLLVPGS